MDRSIRSPPILPQYSAAVAGPPLDVPSAIEGLIEANLALRTQLEANEKILRRALLMLADGSGVARTLQAIPSIDARAAAEVAVKELYEARHEVRQAVIRAALDEGMTVAEVASAFGIPAEQVVGYSPDTSAGR